MCKISQRKIGVYRLHTSSEILWVIPSQLNQCSMDSTSDFAQNCTKCASVVAMKNPQASD